MLEYCTVATGTTHANNYLGIIYHYQCLFYDFVCLFQSSCIQVPELDVADAASSVIAIASLGSDSFQAMMYSFIFLLPQHANYSSDIPQSVSIS
jgi:hypothetical protein